MGGFNLPPGCSTADIDRAMDVGLGCDVCHKIVEACECPECPKCSSFGDPQCYPGGSCGGISEAPPAHDAGCENCHPAEGSCPRHGTYRLINGCEPCAYEAERTADEMYVGAETFDDVRAKLSGVQLPLISPVPSTPR